MIPLLLKTSQPSSLMSRIPPSTPLRLYGGGGAPQRMTPAGSWDHTFYYTYDDAGNRTWLVDGEVSGSATEYIYSNRNQVSRRTVNGTEHTYFDYTPDGNLGNFHSAGGRLILGGIPTTVCRASSGERLAKRWRSTTARAVSSTWPSAATQPRPSRRAGTPTTGRSS